MSQRKFTGVPDDIDGDAVITDAEAAKILGVSRYTIRRRFESGEIGGFRYSITGAKKAAIRFRRSDVVAYKNHCYISARKAS